MSAKPNKLAWLQKVQQFRRYYHVIKGCFFCFVFWRPEHLCLVQIFCRALQLMVMDHHARSACGRFSGISLFTIFFFWGGGEEFYPWPWRQQSNLFTMRLQLMVMHQHMKFTCERFSISFKKSKIHRQYLLLNLWNFVVGKGGRGWSGGGGGGGIRCSGMQLTRKCLREKQLQKKQWKGLAWSNQNHSELRSNTLSHISYIVSTNKKERMKTRKHNSISESKCVWWSHNRKVLIFSLKY